MKSRTLILTSFIAVALIQLLVPAKMIWDQEEVMRDGKVFRFKTEPIDPNDPFRGKYITLSFQEENTNIDIENESNISEVRGEINSWMSSFPLFKY